MNLIQVMLAKGGCIWPLAFRMPERTLGNLPDRSDTKGGATDWPAESALCRNHLLRSVTPQSPDVRRGLT
jgi:hypothetical protein